MNRNNKKIANSFLKIIKIIKIETSQVLPTSEKNFGQGF